MKIDVDILRIRTYSADKGCWELVQAAYDQLGVCLPHWDCPDNPAESLAHKLINEAKECFRRLDGPVPFCLVTFRRMAYEAHIGVVLEDGATFLHQSYGSGVTVSRLDHPKWRTRIMGYWEYADAPPLKTWGRIEEI